MYNQEGKKKRNLIKPKKRKNEKYSVLEKHGKATILG
jgi:hypothetical protein